MAVRLDELLVADPVAAWGACGFAVEDIVCVVGDVRIRFVEDEGGRGVVGWSLRDLLSLDLDGLPTSGSDVAAPAEARAHSNGVTALDHVVAISSDLERTVAALTAAGLNLRRIREEPTPAGAPRQAFFRLGGIILEVV